jgi:DNA mismatch endonuclease (patch repair protein)
MVDVFTPSKRSWIMSRVHGKDTKPEIVVRSVIHRMGYRFRLHADALPGRPDIVLPRHLKVVFVHGCFWHGHKGCARATVPGTRRAFWAKKLADNAARDTRNLREVRRAGWRALVVWECETRKPEKLEGKLRRFLEDGEKTARGRRGRS